jgi:cell division protein FtsW
MKTASTLLALCVAALLALGLVMLYSSSMADKGTPLAGQLMWCAMGLAGCLVMTVTDYRLLRKLAWPLFGLALVLLVMVLVPHIGIRLNGARRWLKVPHTGFGFQPSELAKLALIVAVAWYGERYQRQIGTVEKGIVIPGLFIGAVLGLVFIEPDCGTTILLAAVTGAMLVVAGVRWKMILPPLFAGVAAMAVFLLLNPMRLRRILAWVHQEDHKADTGYQSYQAMLALGSGGWTGLGLGNSREKLGFLPEHDSDFIFSIIGEELGLVATLLVVLAFLLLVISGIYIAWHSRDTFGLLLGSGITFWIGLQAFINIGVVTSALPNKGLPLPFISRGGSSLFMMLLSVGILLSIARRAGAGAPGKADDFEPGAIPAPQMS